MSHNTLRRKVAAVIGALAVGAVFVGNSAIAQQGPGARQADSQNAMPQRPDLAKALGLDEARASKLNAILDGAMETRFALMKQLHASKVDTDKLAALDALRDHHDATRKEIAAMLTADELAKLEKLMPKPAGFRKTQR